MPSTNPPARRFFSTIVAVLNRAIGFVVLLIGVAAFCLPLMPRIDGPFVLGLLMIATAGCQIAYAYVAAQSSPSVSRFSGTGTSLITGLLLLAASGWVFGALAVLLGLSWVIDGIVKLRRGVRGITTASGSALLFDGVISLILGLAIAIQWPFAGAWTVFVAAGLRILTTGWSMLLGRYRAGDQSVVEISNADKPIDPMRQSIIDQEDRRASIDRWWIITFLLMFFAIHIGRMDADVTLVGLFSPFVAVVGDIFFAVVICYAIVVPARLLLGLISQPLASRWTNMRFLGRASVFWQRWHARLSLRLERASKSPAEGLRLGLLVGLPPTAVLVAIAPLLGISWYFNTETWATGAWDHWAAQRTDAWREEMVAAITRTAQASSDSHDSLFRVDPGPIAADEDFSFIVIGDTGEGDASQHILRDQLLTLGARPDVRFLVVSSDIIYPQGAMKDYESKFYLPFKGFNKPIYAIPGNHDWYDALEAFNANFLTPRFAKAALHARREADHRLTSTTDAKIDAMLSQAAILRREYGIRNGEQPAPFFEIQTPHFAMIAVDTGILRNVDEVQLKWVNAALERSRGKFVMVLSGHPLYAAGKYWADDDEAYKAFHQLCREHDVRLFMAGDTHDLEVYHEHFNLKDQQQSMLHIVNGGGGAYLSIGTALDWPANPALPDCAFYPRTDAVVAKLNAETSAWKYPLWWWTRSFKAWPSSPETLASAFASNRAPFYQSFCEIRVSPSTKSVRIRPYTANGRLKWDELQLFGNQLSHDPHFTDPFVEWVLKTPS